MCCCAVLSAVDDVEQLVWCVEIRVELVQARVWVRAPFIAYPATKLVVFLHDLVSKLQCFLECFGGADLAVNTVPGSGVDVVVHVCVLEVFRNR